MSNVSNDMLWSIFAKNYRNLRIEITLVSYGILFLIIGPGRFESFFSNFKPIIVIYGYSISCEIALRWLPLNLTDDKSTLVQVMAGWRQAISHYPIQCWLSSMLPSLGHKGLTHLFVFHSCEWHFVAHISLIYSATYSSFMKQILYRDFNVAGLCLLHHNGPTRYHNILLFPECQHFISLLTSYSDHRCPFYQTGHWML